VEDRRRETTARRRRVVMTRPNGEIEEQNARPVETAADETKRESEAGLIARVEDLLNRSHARTGGPDRPRPAAFHRDDRADAARADEVAERRRRRIGVARRRRRRLGRDPRARVVRRLFHRDGKVVERPRRRRTRRRPAPRPPHEPHRVVVASVRASIDRRGGDGRAAVGASRETLHALHVVPARSVEPVVMRFVLAEDDLVVRRRRVVHAHAAAARRAIGLEQRVREIRRRASIRANVGVELKGVSWR